MKRTPEERQRLAKWWVLQELRYRFLSGPHEGIVDFRLRQASSHDEPDIEIQRSIIEQISELKRVITILKKHEDIYTVECGPDFEKTYRKYEQIVGQIDALSPEPVVFDDDEPSLVFGTKKARIKGYTKEYELCEVIFQYKVGESVDISTVFEAMTGSEGGLSDKDRRMIRDTVNRINKRCQEVLGIPALIKMERNTIRRLR
jgi:hypothetical protein